MSFIRRWWLLVLLGPLIAGAAAFLVVGRLTPVYEATVTLLVSRGSASTGPVDDPTGAETLGRTYVEALRTRPVLEEAERRIGVSMSFSQAQQAVTVRSISGTQLLRLSVDDPDPQVAANLANTIVSVFDEQNQQMQAGRYDNSRGNLEQLVANLRSEIDSRTAELAQLRATLPAGDPQITTGESDLAQLQATYSDSVRSYENLRVAEAQSANGISVIEPAVAPSQPIRPNRLQTIGLAVLGGLVVSVLLGALIEFVDDGLRTRERLATITGLRALATIPRWQGARKGQLATRLSTDTRDRDARQAAEAYRLLFSTLSIAGADESRELRALVVTSAAIGEGKSVTAANLAAVFAEAGKRVILVDADLHRPSQMQRFALSNRTGLSTLLLNPNTSAESVLRDTALPGLRVLTAGPAPIGSSALVTSPRFASRLAEVRDQCDVLVIDTAPVLAQSDPVLIGQLVDGVLFVVDARKSRGRGVRRALEILAGAGVPVFGAAFNEVPTQAQDYIQYAYATDDKHDSAPDEASTSPAAISTQAPHGAA